MGVTPNMETMSNQAPDKRLPSDRLYLAVRKVVEESRKVLSVAANTVLVRQNWSIGKLIVEDEQKGRRKADYGKKTLEALSARLTAGPGLANAKK